MDVREKLFTLFQDCNNPSWKWFPNNAEMMKLIDYLIAHGVTVQEWISIEAGELQNYIGAPVCIKRKTDGERWWAIIRGIKGDKVSTDYGGYFKLSEYGETWIVKYLPLPQPPKGETIYCKDCEHLMFSDCYGECANGHKGIVNPNDTCEHAKRKPPKGE